ncbi:hypothetical protein LCGC14_0747840 [marine sediment metagenome]|uniref:DNA ligase OB-like domain-containing protein n=1 Tax=marine sediment metagenome TaxID=412755 RepID=A0A0F9QPR0_9ZZZZ
MNTSKAIKYRDSLPHPYFKVKDYDEKKHGDKGPFFAERKLDGEWCTWKAGELYGRRADWRGLHVNKWDLLPERLQQDLRNQYARLRGCLRDDLTKAINSGDEKLTHLFANPWLVGELEVDGGSATDVPKALKSGYNIDNLRVVSYGVQGVSATPQDIRNLLVQAEIPRPASVGLIAYPDTEELLNCARANGWEGVILYPNRAFAQPYRLKDVQDYDVIVMGYEMAGAGKFMGMIGALLVGWHVNGELVEVGGVGSGWTHAERRALSKKDLSRVCTITTRQFASKGAFKHATFKRWRDDKPVADCVAPGWWVEKYRGG